MNKRSNIMVALLLALTFALSSCGNSVVSSTSTGNDVGFDPSKDSSLQTLHFNSLQESLFVDFGLASGSAASTMLTARANIFNQSVRDYSALFATNYTTIMAKACEESDLSILFPNGPSIDTAWKKLTQRPVSQISKDLEKEILAKVGNQPDDVKVFALCLAVALDARTVFTNFVEGI